MIVPLKTLLGVVIGGAAGVGWVALMQRTNPG